MRMIISVVVSHTLSYIANAMLGNAMDNAHVTTFKPKIKNPSSAQKSVKHNTYSKAIMGMSIHMKSSSTKMVGAKNSALILR